MSDIVELIQICPLPGRGPETTTQLGMEKRSAGRKVMDGEVCSRRGEITGLQAKGQAHTQATDRTGSTTRDNGGEKPAAVKTTEKARLCAKSSAERPGGSAAFPSTVLEVKKLCATPTTKRELAMAKVPALPEAVEMLGALRPTQDVLGCIGMVHHLSHLVLSTRRWAASSLSPPRVSACPAPSPSLSSSFASPPGAAHGSASAPPKSSAVPCAGRPVCRPPPSPWLPLCRFHLLTSRNGSRSPAAASALSYGGAGQSYGGGKRT